MQRLVCFGYVLQSDVGVCVLSYVHRGSLCSVRSGSVCARCLWVIMSGYNEPLLRVNGGSLAALGDCNYCRLNSLLLRCENGERDLNFRETLIMLFKPVDVPLERSPAKAVKPAL